LLFLQAFNFQGTKAYEITCSGISRAGHHISQL